MPQSDVTENFDIVIVGGGINGQALALALIDRCRQARIPDFTVALVDGRARSLAPVSAQSGIAVFHPRVSAFTPASRNFFEELGLWAAIEAMRVCPYREMFVWDSDGTGNIHFDGAEIQRDHLGYIVENDIVSAVLHTALLASEEVVMIEGDELVSFERSGSDDGCKLVLSSGRILNCRLLVGADGGNSFVREQAGFSVKAWDYGHQAIVATVRTEKPHGFTARQCFLPGGPLAFLPLMNPDDDAEDQQIYSSIVWSCEPERARQLTALDPEAFRQELAEAFEHRLGAIIDTGPRYSFPLWQRHARDYVQTGIALVGDAAHTIHPLAGQGVNLGLRDAQVLSEVLCEASSRGENFASLQVLSRYQRRRKGQNLGMMVAMEAFKRGFASEDLMVRWLRNIGLSGVNRMPPIKRQLMKRAIE